MFIYQWWLWHIVSGVDISCGYFLFQVQGDFSFYHSRCRYEHDGKRTLLWLTILSLQTTLLFQLDIESFTICFKFLSLSLLPVFLSLSLSLSLCQALWQRRTIQHRPEGSWFLIWDIKHYLKITHPLRLACAPLHLSRLGEEVSFWDYDLFLTQKGQ